MVPISFALHSLIYPFAQCIFVPCLLNDGEDSGLNSINLVSSPLNYFIGICSADKDIAFRALEDDGFDPPLIVDVDVSSNFIGDDTVSFKQKTRSTSLY